MLSRHFSTQHRAAERREPDSTPFVILSRLGATNRRDSIRIIVSVSHLALAMSAQSIDSHVNAAPLGSISSFTLHHRAGYAAYVRAIYCVPSLVEVGAQEVIETERIGDAINLGRDEVRSLKGLDIPSGAQVQFVLEVVAAPSGHQGM